MSYNLFLDDERHPSQVTWVDIGFHPFQCIIVRNFEQFKHIIEEHGLPERVSFDHDLADFHYEAMIEEVNGKENVDYGPEKTGFDCAKFLAQYCIDTSQQIPDFTVHSLNPVGRDRINQHLERAKLFIDSGK